MSPISAPILSTLATSLVSMPTVHIPLLFPTHMMIFSTNIDPGCYTLELLGMIIHTLKILIDDEDDSLHYARCY